MVVLVEPRSIPKTTSGKIQRHKCKIGYKEGSLKVRCTIPPPEHSIPYHRPPPPSSPAPPPTHIHIHQTAYVWEAGGKEGIKQAPPALGANRSSFIPPAAPPSLGNSSDEDDAATFFSCYELADDFASPHTNYSYVPPAKPKSPVRSASSIRSHSPTGSTISLVSPLPSPSVNTPPPHESREEKDGGGLADQEDWGMVTGAGPGAGGIVAEGADGEVDPAVAAKTKEYIEKVRAWV